MSVLTLNEMKEREQLLVYAQSKTRWMSKEEQDRLAELNSKLNDRISGYHFDQMFRCFVKEHTNEYPKQTIEIIVAIDKKETGGIGNLQFTEEVKDGRMPKFDNQSPLQLKGKNYAIDDIELIIEDIIPKISSNQPFDVNQHWNYNYHIVFKINYKSRLDQHEDAAHKAFMNKQS